jgi:hypothetical protein
VASSPQAARQMAARAGTAVRPAGTVARRGGTCPACRQGRRNLRFRGPVTISIQGR